MADQAIDMQRMEELFRQARARLEDVGSVRPQVQRRIAAMQVEPASRVQYWWGGAIAALLILYFGYSHWSSIQAQNTLKIAIENLNNCRNFSWSISYLDHWQPTPEVPGAVHSDYIEGNVRWRCDGKTENGGFTQMALSLGSDHPTNMIRFGEQAVISSQEGWSFPSEIPKETLRLSEWPGAGQAWNIPTPVATANILFGQLSDIHKEGDHIAARIFTQDNVPSTAFINFWIKDGVLTKFEERLDAPYHELSTTTSISNIGTTLIDVPEAAKIKLGAGRVVNPGALPFQ